MSAEAQVLFDYVQRNNAKFLGNMFFPYSPGHMIWELDNFLRMKHLGEIPSNIKYFGFFAESPLNLALDIAAIFPDVLVNNNCSVMVNSKQFNNAVAIQALFPELCIDCGLSHFKTILPSSAERLNARLLHLPGSALPLTWVLSHKLNHERTLDYFRRRTHTKDFNPFKTTAPLTPQLADLLGGKCEKIALVHVRNLHRGRGSAGNAGIQTDPSSLLPALQYLLDSGYTIVKVGHEHFPTEWNSLPIINYQSSGLLSYANDLRLLSAASLVLVNASGFQNFSDVIGTPMVIYGTWPIAAVPPSEKIVHVPTLLQGKCSGKTLKFIEQMNHSFGFHELWEKGDCLNFPSSEFVPLSPTSQDILEGVQEATALGEQFIPRSALQEQFVNLSPNYFYKHVHGRVSQRFLEKHIDLLSEGL
jgi:putative glycosyltransferase (TIGR04372 family)